MSGRSAILIGLGAYLLYRYGPAFLSHLPSLSPTSPTSTTSSIDQARSQTTKQLVAAEAARTNPGIVLFNHDQWSHFFAAVRGADGPAFEEAWPGRDRGYRMTLDEWWAGVAPLLESRGMGNYAVMSLDRRWL